jgi:hypothetical protein
MEIRMQIDDDYCQGNGAVLEPDDDIYEPSEDEKVIRKPKSVRVGRERN